MRIRIKETMLILVMVLIGLQVTLVIADDPANGVEYWNFSSNTGLWDSTTGTNYGATSVSVYPTYNNTGDSGPTSYFFDGSNDWFDTTITAATAQLGYSWWYNGTETGVNCFMGSYTYSPYRVLQFVGNLPVADSLYFAVYSGSSSTSFIFYSDAFNWNNGEWHHIYVGADIPNHVGEVWFDGEEIATTVTDSNLNTGFTHTYPIFIGARSLNGNPGYYMDGIMDDVQIYNEMLNETEIKNIYNYGIPNYVPVTDTCTCPGIDTDWEVELSDNCDIVDACDLGTGDLSFIGAGNFTCNATIDAANVWLNNSVSTARYITGKDCRIWFGD